jgi:CBS domain-containing protein
MRHRVVLRVMTSEPAVAHEDTGFAAMVDLMAGNRVDMLPVVDGDGKVLGVVSSTDLLAKESVLLRPNGVSALLRRNAERVKSRGTTAGGLMSSPAITVTPDSDVTRAARLMADHRVHCLPVVDHAGKLVGVVSRADVLRVFLRHDHEIAEDIDLEVLRGGFGIDPTTLEIVVSDGIVHMGGTVERRSWVAVIGSLVRQIDGVVDVVTTLRYSWDDTSVAIPDAMAVDITHEPRR